MKEKNWLHSSFYDSGFLCQLLINLLPVLTQNLWVTLHGTLLSPAVVLDGGSVVVVGGSVVWAGTNTVVGGGSVVVVVGAAVVVVVVAVVGAMVVVVVVVGSGVVVVVVVVVVGVVVVVVVVVVAVVVVVGRSVVVVAAAVVDQVAALVDSGKVAVVWAAVTVVEGAVTAAVVSLRPSSSVTSRPGVTSNVWASVEDSGSVDTVVGDRDGLTVVVVVVDAVVSVEEFLTGTGTVVFHWWLEKGLVMLAGSVTSWSPTVDRSDSGTVGRSQAGKLLMDSSARQEEEGQI